MGDGNNHLRLQGVERTVRLTRKRPRDCPKISMWRASGITAPMATKLRLRQRTARSTDLETSIAHRARRPPIDDRRPARRRRRRGAAKKIRRSDTTIPDRHRNRRSRRTEVSLPVRGSPSPLPHHHLSGSRDVIALTVSEIFNDDCNSMDDMTLNDL